MAGWGQSSYAGLFLAASCSFEVARALKRFQAFPSSSYPMSEEGACDGDDN